MLDSILSDLQVIEVDIYFTNTGMESQRSNLPKVVMVEIASLA